MNIPTSARGVLIAVALLLFMLVVVYATTLLTIIIGGLAIGSVTYGVYLIGYNTDAALKRRN